MFLRVFTTLTLSHSSFRMLTIYINLKCHFCFDHYNIYIISKKNLIEFKLKEKKWTQPRNNFPVLSVAYPYSMIVSTLMSNQ